MNGASVVATKLDVTPGRVELDEQREHPLGDEAVIHHVLEDAITAGLQTQVTSCILVGDLHAQLVNPEDVGVLNSAFDVFEVDRNIVLSHHSGIVVGHNRLVLVDFKIRYEVSRFRLVAHDVRRTKFVGLIDVASICSSLILALRSHDKRLGQISVHVQCKPLLGLAFAGLQANVDLFGVCG